jgi:uncharacterized membrane protein
MTELLQTWGSFYANHAAIRTIVAFVHVGALIAGGGLAVATDRVMLRAIADDELSRRSVLESLQDAHRIVIGSLVLITISGVLLFASDFDTFLYSKFFWIKMALVVFLVLNGAVLRTAERRALAGDSRAWTTVRATAVASIALWFLTTLGGVALPNIG